MPGFRISKIEPLGKAHVYDLSVDNTPNYVLKGGLVSHNSGKSWSCLRVAEELDENFCIDQVVFDAKELMRLLNSDTLKTGSVIIFEEAGVALSNRNWQNVVNKVINYLFQTFRHRRFILLLNSPYMDFVDKATRKLIHAELQVVNIDKDKKQTIVKPQLIQYNGRRDKFYYKYLRVPVKGKGVFKVQRWAVDIPSKDLRDLYEAKKLAYTKALNKDILAQINAQDKKNSPKPEWICGECEYVWTPRSKMPPMCPKCKGSARLSQKVDVSS